MKPSPYVRSRCTIAFLLGILTLAITPAGAQSTGTSERRNNAAISGIVRDASGGIIPRSTIVIREDSSALERIIDGQSGGSFSIPGLASSRYVLTVSAPGFARETRVVDAPRVSPLSLTLTPAPIVEQVTVVSASRQQELRDTLNTRVDVITRSRIEETGGHETVGEILRELPGVITRRGSETAGAAGEQIQGIDSRQVLVLLDGQPMVGARGIKRGGVLNLDRQSTARLDRVLRGTFVSSWVATRATLSDGGVQDTIAPRFALWDAFVSQQIGRGLSAFVTVDNLANSQDPNTGVLLPTGAPAAIYRPDVGRTARVGVRWSFSPR
jgi:outer membrane receptor protein involved in Fe transport